MSRTKGQKTSGYTQYRRWRWTLFGRLFEYKSDEIANSYMRRWVLLTPWFILRLHHILRSDSDRHFHDHPMDFTSFILVGGYTEYTPEQPPRTYYPGDIVRRKAEDLHFLKLRGETAWTFLVTGPYRRDWGFATEDGWIKADKYDAYMERKRKNAATPLFGRART